MPLNAILDLARTLLERFPSSNALLPSHRLLDSITAAQAAGVIKHEDFIALMNTNLHTYRAAGVV